MTERPWAPGAATGVGSLPGTDPRDAAALVLGELPGLPHLVELPARGPGAGMIGRAAALLVELPVEIVPTGWRLAAHPGRDLSAARDLLARDLDALEEAADGWQGPLKLQVTGPWTLAAALELPNGNRAVGDHGAVRDLTASLAEGVRGHLADVVGRVPGARPVLQLDEPGLPAVLAGRVPTPSGYGTVRSVAAPVAEQALRDVLAVAPPGARVVHCCAPDVPFALFAAAGADAVAVDADLLRTSHYDLLGDLVDAGVSLWLGVVASTGERGFEDARAAVRSLWRDLGFAPRELAASVVPTPACGLAGVTAAAARRALRTVRDVGRSLLDDQG
ncbi:Cobalamin-independent synthase, Catalytic domain [Jatrophihabitans endophyticus]|uniref:Cobalamin-independent synthase, Catalytic domain n=1 Tax=Jatrophihabitans endophyticus TaxID=1206085 RepID=A0A1M5DB54_9ACTN|nr:methionine synthase [Jatrophihabitans endophyticus]SHF64227.1 Cobalamin-independent synthase, Catalytic domain [Jatrophihabitans endophyticus]